MSASMMIERLFESLVSGDRAQVRQIVQETVDQGVPAQALLMELYWPVHNLFEKLHRADQMNLVNYNMGTRMLRMLVDQAAGRLEHARRNGQTIFATCGKAEGEELACQMACDMMESAGFEVTFTGGGIPADEVLAQVQERRPDFLVLFASAASDLPGIRSIVDTLREINAVPDTKIAVGGGVFNRAEGLAEEIGIDLHAADPMEMVELLTMPDLERVVVPTKVEQPVKARRKKVA